MPLEAKRNRSRIWRFAATSRRRQRLWLFHFKQLKISNHVDHSADAAQPAPSWIEGISFPSYLERTIANARIAGCGSPDACMYHAPGIEATGQLLIEVSMYIVPRYEVYGLIEPKMELTKLQVIPRPGH